MEHMAHYTDLVPLGFMLHVYGAPVALALAPLQLWSGLRQSRPTVHRWVGRAYGVAILAAALGSVMFLPHFLGHPSSALGFAVLAVLWVATTALGIGHAMRGDIVRHRRWMLRSVALTFAAVTLRLIMLPLMLSGWEVTETYLITAWACWVPNLLVVEAYLRRHPAVTAA
jgi:uncharacterized membrane protein